MQEVLHGIQLYRSATYQREMPATPVFASQGSARILAFLPKDGHTPEAALFLIPSLINRYYIMDLSEQRSIARYLASQNIACYLVDWGDPSDHEHGYDCAAYIRYFLQPMLHTIHAAHTDTPIHIAGHCMGGILAAGLAVQQPKDSISGLALLATPWDFSPEAMQTAAMGGKHRSTLEHDIDAHERFAGDHMLMLFYLRDPWLFQEKLRQFPSITDPVKRQHFIALEDWANDCVDLTRGVARDCLIHWGADNALMRGRWQAGDAPLTPERLQHTRLFFALPKHDRIVPPASSEALARHFPHATTIRPDSGHVGMLVGSRAQTQLWEPLKNWVLN